MISKYHVKNFVTFSINKIEYSLHKDMTERIAIFRIYDDCDVQNILQLDWPISAENIESMFNCLYDPSYTCDKNIQELLEIRSFASYIGMDKIMFDRILKKLVNNDLKKFIDDCCKLKYCDEILMLFDDVFKFLHVTFDILTQSIDLEKMIEYFPKNARLHIMYSALISCQTILYPIESGNMSPCAIHAPCKIIYAKIKKTVFRSVPACKNILYEFHIDEENITHVLVNNKNIDMITDNAVVDVHKTIFKHCASVLMKIIS